MMIGGARFGSVIGGLASSGGEGLQGYNCLNSIVLSVGASTDIAASDHAPQINSPMMRQSSMTPAQI